MAIVHERVWGGCSALSCGENKCDGYATAIAEHKSYKSAKRQASNRVKRLKYDTWKAIRKLKCPKSGSPEEDCPIKRITYIYSPAPRLGMKHYFKNKKVWWVQYTIRWKYRVKCQKRSTELAWANQVKADAKEVWVSCREKVKDV